jgi:hypothetical protein
VVIQVAEGITAILQSDAATVGKELLQAAGDEDAAAKKSFRHSYKTGSGVLNSDIISQHRGALRIPSRFINTIILL